MKVFRMMNVKVFLMFGSLLLCTLGVQMTVCGQAQSESWQVLFQKAPSKEWIECGNAKLDPENSKRLKTVEGNSVLVSTKRGEKDLRNLVSDDDYGDLEVHLEFMLSKGSNAGVKLQSLYEIQLYDSQSIEKPTALHSGGVYPRANKSPGRYVHIDEGTPPRVNAAMAPGVWQSLHIRFRAPNVDSAGNKLSNARFELVELNDQVVQKDVEVRWPTGSDWVLPESSTGRLYLQGDHGPVAYRNVRVRPLRAIDE